MHPAILIPLLFAVFCLIIYRSVRKQPISFTWKEVVVILGVRVLLGFLYGYVFARYFQGDDTWYFHNGSIDEQKKLLSYPFQFFADLNPIPAFARNKGFEAGWYYYLSDLEFWLMTKPMAFFNLVTNGNYYSNVVCLNFLTCWGSIWLYRLYLSIYSSKKTLLFLLVFVLPIPLFWMSGIRAEGWLLFFIAGALTRFHRLLKGIRWQDLSILILCLLGIMVLRSVLLLILIPVLLAWWMNQKFNWKTYTSMLAVMLASTLLFFASTYLNEKTNLPSLVVKRQQSFFALHGQTRISLDTLSASPASFIRIFPQAVRNSFLRPYVWEAKGILQILASLSTLFLLTLIVIYIFRSDRKLVQLLSEPLIFYPACFAFLLYLFIGYTIPFPGAIVRYKSVGEWFLIGPLLLSIRWRNRNK